MIHRLVTIASVTLLLVLPLQAGAQQEVDCDGRAATIVGTPEDDSDLRGTEGADVIVGLGGDDVIRGLEGPDIICGGRGADVLWADGGSGEPEVGHQRLLGGSGADTVIGGIGGDALRGGDGDDILEGDPSGGGGSTDGITPGPGDDTVDGGPGEPDTVDYWPSLSAVTVDLIDGSATGEGTDALRSIERVIGSPFGDVLHGANLVGRGGDDQMTLVGRVTNLLGDDGNDSIVATSEAILSPLCESPDSSAYSGGNGDDVLDFRLANRDGSECPLLIWGLSGRDTLYGSLSDEELAGGRGKDVVYGMGGADLVLGGDPRSDDDVDGRDRLFGGAGSDRLDLLGSSPDVGRAGAGDDFINALDGHPSDVLWGGAGFDTCGSDPDDSANECESPSTS